MKNENRTLFGWCKQRGSRPFTSSTRPRESANPDYTRKLAVTNHATRNSHLEFVFQFTRVLPKNTGASVQNLGDLLYREKALLLENPDDALNVPLTHGENFRATVKHPL